MPVEENGIDRAVLLHKEETLYRTRPHWSPDGARFVYSSHLGGQFSNLFVLPAEGGEPYKLTFGEWDAFHPRWSSDGEWIAYASNEEGSPQLRLLQTFGGKGKGALGSGETVERPRWTRSCIRSRSEFGRSVAGSYLQSGLGWKKLCAGGRLSSARSAGRAFLPTPMASSSSKCLKGSYTWRRCMDSNNYAEAQAVDVKAGDTLAVTMTLGRMVDLQTQGWYSGSNHVHMNYAGNLHNTPENLVFMAEG